MTLVEAVAGTAVLGTVLVAVLVAHGRMTLQATRAGERLDACTIADDLLAGWWLDREQFPREGAGDIPSRPGWTWRTRRVPSDAGAAFKADVVALSVFAPGRSQGQPAVRVEVMVPIDEKQNKDKRADAH